MCLSDLNVSDKCVVLRVNSCGVIRRRLMDIGVLPGTVISCVLSSPGGNPKAYLIKGSVIGIRNADASSIEVDLL